MCVMMGRLCSLLSQLAYLQVWDHAVTELSGFVGRLQEDKVGEAVIMTPALLQVFNEMQAAVSGAWTTCIA